ncbi:MULTISPECIES: phosphoadenosine phosphosulfate reductase family protein [unclassified Lacrimispora]|uniref:phosphoadenosine phosphosulfate reductase domain-containing protein n=1 Tax=unclassified Lacrimispora TaxID=2719232 RepID=UPI00376F86E1
MQENKHTKEDLKSLQALSLPEKIGVTQARLMEWYNRNDKQCYVSFSGGKDSTVLAYLAAQVCDLFQCKLVLWFSDTGLEFPELREHVKSYGEFLKTQFPDLDVEIIIDTPKYTRGKKKGQRILFKDVVLENGYPILSKNVSRQIGDIQNLGNSCWAARCFDGRETGMYDMRRWNFVLNAPFKVSNKCCDIMKKRPAKQFTKKSGLKPIIGTMTCESKQRKTEWLHNGCNAFDKKNPTSQPISFWTEQDVLEYIVKFNLPYPSVYGDIQKDDRGTWYTTGYCRTGCMFCAYGCHLEKEPNRFQMLKKTHRNIWNYCMKPVSEGGLGMREVLEYIGVKIE